MTAPPADRPKRKLWKYVLAASCILIAMVAYTFFGPDTPIVISKKTTFLLGPLDADGNIDYFEALRSHRKKGVTPENNAVVLLWQAFGTRNLFPEDVGPHFKELGMAVPPKEGNYLVDLCDESFLKKGAEWLHSIRFANNLTNDEDTTDTLDSDFGAESLHWSAFDDISTMARYRPWTSQDVPPLGKWLEENKKPIDLIFKATKRSHFYAPMYLDAQGEETMGIIMIRSGTIQNSRDAAYALTTRAMWNLGNKHVEAAWQDILACYRLGHLISTSKRGGVIEMLVRVAIEAVASDSLLSVLDQDLSLEQLKKIKSDFANLDGYVGFSNTFYRNERLSALEIVTAISRGASIEGLSSGGESDRPGFALKLSIDWNVPMERANELFDDITAAASEPKFADRTAALSEVDSKWEAWHGELATPKTLILSKLSKQGRSEQIASVLLGMMTPALIPLDSAANGRNTSNALTTVAIELAIHRAKHGGYPTSLEELGEDVFKELPLDLYTEKPFNYKKTKEGYLLTSVGPNMLDDGGSNDSQRVFEGVPLSEEEIQTTLDETIGPDSNPIPSNADDHAIRMPRPTVDWKALAAGSNAARD